MTGPRSNGMSAVVRLCWVLRVDWYIKEEEAVGAFAVKPTALIYGSLWGAR